MKSTAIILSAGQGKRMQTEKAKQYLLINGKPMLYYSLKAFADSAHINNIIIVINETDYDYVKNEIIDKYQIAKITDIVVGGKERYHSVYNGINADGASDSDFIFIHDGARPLINEDIISRAAEEVRSHPAIVVGMPVKDTIKRIDEANLVGETPDRRMLWAVQTPQVFAASLIREGYQELMTQESVRIVTDDAMVVETFTKTKVKLILGSYQNIKVTTREDLKIAEVLLLSYSNEGFPAKS
ncbi:MAG: 2-C-methyl-D-erythritol 4-phosphate cytidylyltransferase [Lachnospiraceae bacterium]|nr:2-C-methyl-D-erythritol 4-phosphate cytidylyltransferase [Lachnospiraceae bacterium]